MILYLFKIKIDLCRQNVRILVLLKINHGNPTKLDDILIEIISSFIWEIEN